MNSNSRKYIGLVARLLISIVLLWNIQCAIVFLLRPVRFAPGFHLPTGLVGDTVIRSIGLLFVMWNVPYIFAALQPIRWKVLSIVIVIQQFLAVIGEIWILSFLNTEPIIQASVLKFIYFDLAGLGLLTLTVILIYSQRNQKGEK